MTVAVQLPAHLLSERTRRFRTWRWYCARCHTWSFCTFATSDDALRYGGRHVCRKADL